MKKDYMEACMNATRQRIIQAIMIKKEATAEIITVVKEEFKRGSVEKTYAIAPQMPYDDTNEEYNSLIQSALM